MGVMASRTGARVPATASLASGALFESVPALAELNAADPYPAYESLYGAPVEAAGGDVVIVTRFAECVQLLRHPDVTSERQGSPAFRGVPSSNLNLMDPPEHTRIRGLVSDAFTPRSIEALRTWLEDLVHDLLDRADTSEFFDVVPGLAYPLPVYAICQLLNVPAEDRDMLMGWSKAITPGVDLLAGRRSREQQSAYRLGMTSFRHYINELAERRRAAPGDDLLTRLIMSAHTGDELTRREISANAINLLIAGHETTVGLIGAGAITLVQRPDLRDRLAADPALAEAFVEEVLRYHSPVQGVVRMAAKDLIIGGVSVRAGTALLLILAAANRDPEQFEDPNEFRIDRPNNRTHMAFAIGRHFCLGAPLARLEGRIALSAMAARLVNPRVRPDGISFGSGIMLRSPSRLEIDIDGVRPRPPSGVLSGARSGAES